jgi:signal transduction histidine kinase/ActR/RegA family two-component response regulator
MRNFIRDFFQLSIFSNLRVMDGDYDNVEDDSNDLAPDKSVLIQWREQLYFVIFFSFLLFLFIPLVQSAVHSYQHEQWSLLAIHLVCYLSVAVIVFFRRIPFFLRVIIGLIVVYIPGIAGLILIGADSSGRLWLFSFSIIATLFLGLRAGLAAVAVNVITVFAIGYMLSTGHLQWPDDKAAYSKIWAITGVTFIFLNSVVTVSLAILVRALESNLVRSQLVSMKLREANKQLKEAQNKREKLEGQLVQAQKMESVGRLAGGVAHDYNNISSIIVGYSELILSEMTPDNPLYEEVKEIYTAAIRSTEITRQLLAFARKQTIEPQVIKLEESLEMSLKMLKRLVGEDIDVVFDGKKKIWPVKLDPSQLDQIMANLCVNARDSIQDVGKIIIGLENVTLDEEYSNFHVEVEPGDYVLLTVADDGCGIAPENLEKIFDPFFTTKDMGKGTGLGLATIYGIIQQNNGFVHVYSELDRGTQFRMYFPRYIGEVEEQNDRPSADLLPGQGEFILLSEDDPAILKLSKRLLVELNYQVLAAESPREALILAEKHTGDIHLLMTDVIMPEMNGRELSEKLKETYPAMQTLFVSGYTSDLIARRGVLEDGVNFLSKPFSKKTLAQKLRCILGKRQSCK